jgi:hypothetical protein
MLAFATAAFGADLGNYFDPSSPPANHHVHDCTLPASQCVYPHLGVGFFPTILGESLTAYLQDPAECNDATDKTLLPPNVTSKTPQEEQPLRAGVCYTATTLIHMRSIDATPAQLALAWLLQHENVIAIPKTSSVAHVAENRVAATLQLSAATLAELDAAFPPPRSPSPLAVI